MADNTHIEWADATWQPITGCAVVSPGCTNCYAMRLAGTRLRNHPSRAGLTRNTKAGPVWNGEVRFNADWLDQPLRWRRPRRIFVCAHGDLFAEAVPDIWIDRVFAVMALAPRHTFLVLTKRARRMRGYLTANTGPWDSGHACGRIATEIERLRKTPDCRARGLGPNGIGPVPYGMPGSAWWPMPNVWLGVSVEDQARADERVPELLATPAVKRFVSAEPLLGPVNLWHLRQGRVDALYGLDLRADNPVLDWVILGGESGPGARPMHPDWARSLREQCHAAGVPFFFKQWGEWAPGDHGKSEANDCVLLNTAGSVVYAARGTWPGNMQLMQRVGKRAAGRRLDGRAWEEFPA